MQAARGPLITVFGLIGAAATAGARAQSPVGGSLALTSDYVYHGLSYTCGDPAAQADLHFRTGGGQTASNGFIGLWGSQGLGRSECGGARELNIYGGYSFAVDQNSRVTVSYTRYAYPGGSYTIKPLAGYRYDYDELQAAWAYQDRIYLTVGWTPDALGYGDGRLAQNRSAFTYGLEVHQPLLGSLTLSAGVGYDEIADLLGSGYAFWNVGLAYTVGAFELGASYFRTATRAEQLFGPYVAGGRGAATLVWRF